MAKWSLPREVAREIVAGGAIRKSKSVQRISRREYVGEPQVALASLNGDWQAVAGGGLVGSGVIVGANGLPETGTLAIYAPSVSDVANAPKGCAHVAQVNGRWELLSGEGADSLSVEAILPLVGYLEDGTYYLKSGLYFDNKTGEKIIDNPSGALPNSCHVRAGKNVKFVDGGGCNHGAEDGFILEIECTAEKGDKGDKGDPGAQGEKGDKGDKGDPGEKGETGAQGEKGDKGDKGDPGEKGETGATGAQGEKGEKGDPGTPGATGAQGEKGEKGDKGDQGEPGAPGAPGTPGEQGPQGERGATGEKGEKGDDGRDATVIVSGSSEIQVESETDEEDNSTTVTLEWTPERSNAICKPKLRKAVVTGVESSNSSQGQDASLISELGSPTTVYAITALGTPTTESFVQTLTTQTKEVVTSVALVLSDVAVQGGIAVVTKVECSDGSVVETTKYIALQYTTEQVEVVASQTAGNAVTAFPSPTKKKFVTAYKSPVLATLTKEVVPIDAVLSNAARMPQGASVPETPVLGEEEEEEEENGAN